MSNTYKEYRKQLEGAYLETFEKMELYYRASNLDAIEFDECMNELLDLFLMAQSEQKPVDKIVGNDLETYCKNYMKEMFPNKRARDICSSIILGGVVLFITSLLFFCVQYFTGAITSLWNGKYDLSGSMFGIVIVIVLSFVGNIIIRNVVFTTNRKWLKRFQYIKWILYIALFLIAAMLHEVSNFKFVISLKEATFLSLIVVTFGVFCYAIVANTIMKYDWKNNKDEVYEKSYIKALQKRFLRKNNALKKSGKDVLSSSDFAIKMRKELKITRWMLLAFLLIFIIEFICLIYLAITGSILNTEMVFILLFLMICIIFLFMVVFTYRVNTKLLEELQTGTKTLHTEME